MFEKSFKLLPTATASNNLGTVYFYMRRYDEAAQAYEEAIRLGVNRHRVWGNLGDAYRYTHARLEKITEAYENAVSLAEDMLEVNSDDARTRGCLAAYLSHLGEHERAVDEIEEACALAPSDVEVLLHRVLVFELAGHREKALHALEAGIKAGVSINELEDHPDLVDLRRDTRYQHILQVESSARD
jgi:serine/threonine-protein kinase